MQWVKDSTPESGRFLIVTGHSWPRIGSWRVSRVGPAVSLVTPQGTEWTTDGRFARLNEASALAQACAEESEACISMWEQRTRLQSTPCISRPTLPGVAVRSSPIPCGRLALPSCLR